MTRDEILNMPAGRVLDAVVAERVLNWTHIKHNELLNEYSVGKDPDVGWRVIPNFSTDIAAAWEVVEKMPFGYELRLCDYKGSIVRWQAEFHEPGAKTLMVWADTAPLAICRAALLAMIE